MGKTTIPAAKSELDFIWLVSLLRSHEIGTKKAIWRHNNRISDGGYGVQQTPSRLATRGYGQGSGKIFRSESNQVDEHLVYGGGDHGTCESLLKFGIQESDFDRRIEEVIGRPAFFVHQGPVIIHSSDHPTDLGIGAAHPSRDGISVFRALSSNPEDITATLKLYPMSHHLFSTEFARQGGATKSICDRRRYCSWEVQLRWRYHCQLEVPWSGNGFRKTYGGRIYHPHPKLLPS